MAANFQQWLNRLPYDIPLLQRQARLLQAMFTFLISGALIGIVLAPVSNQTTESLIAALTVYTIVIIGIGVAWWLLRRGFFRAAAVTVATILMLAISGTMVAFGTQQHAQYTLPSLLIPIVLVGLTMKRQALWITCGVAILSFAAATLGSIYLPQWFGFIHLPSAGPFVLISGFTLVIVVIGFILDRFGNSLQDALKEAHEREQELETLRASLERTVAERTASLQQTIEELRASQETVRALSAPALPVLPGVLVLPLIGAFDTRRIADLSDTALRAVDQRRAKVVIFDVTGITMLDTATAQALLHTAAAVRLLGAESWLVGLRAEVAQTIVELDVDLRAFRTYANLEDAIGVLVRGDAQRAAPTRRGAGTSLNGNG
ncbi:STAS domain-containing protein [Roseiflexus sp.]|uniref:STAS domain-containing protein n=1 Tax=Roseiflexus sp. TaxID=2562120 RepID=UPI00398B8518